MALSADMPLILGQLSCCSAPLFLLFTRRVLEASSLPFSFMPLGFPGLYAFIRLPFVPHQSISSIAMSPRQAKGFSSLGLSLPAMMVSDRQNK